MKVFLVSILLFNFLGVLKSQPIGLEGEALKRYRKITRKSISVPSDYSSSTYYLADYLTSGSSSDLEKARALYVWVASNISFDMKGFKEGILPEFDPRIVLANRLAVCEGFSRLFNELCLEAGLQSG